MATPFSDLYESVRVATGNDDPVVGTEVMPDSRIDVLIRTAVPNLSSYSDEFETAGFQVTSGAATYELYPASDTAGTLEATTLTAISLVAAHRFYIGIGNWRAAEELRTMIANLALAVGGEPITGYKAEGVLAERFQVI